MAHHKCFFSIFCIKVDFECDHEKPRGDSDCVPLLGPPSGSAFCGFSQKGISPLSTREKILLIPAVICLALAEGKGIMLPFPLSCCQTIPGAVTQP